MLLPPSPDLSPTQQGLAWLTRPYDFLRECAAAHGDAFTLDLGVHGTYVLFSRPEAIREIFTGDPRALHAGKGNQVLRPFLGAHSLLLLEEQEHLAERRMLLPAFHGKRIASHGETIHALVLDHIRGWTPGAPLDVQDAMQKLTLEVILRVVFGLEDGDALRLLRGHLQRFLNDPKFNLALIGELDGELGESESWRAFRNLFAEIRHLIDAQVRHRRAQATAAPEDVLGMMLQARRDDGRALDDEELRDELVTLVVTGYETTATALAWSFYWIDRVPEARRRLTELLSDRPLDDALREPYLEAFCKEVLRIHPVIPVVARQVQKRVEITGHVIDPGVTVAPCIYLTHHREDIYEAPDEFRPSRFLERKFDPYEYLPFGGGARRCIGMPLALWEMKAVLSAVVPHWRLTLPEGVRVRPVRRSVTVAPSGGPRLTLEPRHARSAQPGEPSHER
ncbi:MAG: cytochrome P450 [Myxococcota bacterium]